jgi:membrane fusion protein (multidrug efflux system)
MKQYAYVINCFNAILLAVAVVAATSGLTACGKKETATVGRPEVLVVEAPTRDVPVYREWIGTFDGSADAEIKAHVTGYLIKRDYQEGTVVKKGALLFEIDPRPFEAALAEAKSELEGARATQAASQIDVDRSKALVEQHAMPEKDYTNKKGLNDANIAKVAALEAKVEEAQLNLGFCKITSPVEGIAAVARAQVGDLVGPANVATLTSVDTLDPMKIVLPISESDYFAASQRMQESMSKPFDQRPDSTEVFLADGSLFPHKARLFSVDLQEKASTGTILVTGLLSNPGSVLRPGFYARARIVVQTLKDAVVVPQRAVYEVQGSYQLGIIGADGKAEIRPVNVGPRVSSDWVITSGLKPGEKVVVEGLQKIKAGMPVVAKPWTRPSENPGGAKSAEQPVAKEEKKSQNKQ